jgi:hypothetical protein
MLVVLFLSIVYPSAETTAKLSKNLAGVGQVKVKPSMVFRAPTSLALQHPGQNW